jgi:hypothetical protein
MCARPDRLKKFDDVLDVFVEAEPARRARSLRSIATSTANSAAKASPEYLPSKQPAAFLRQTDHRIVFHFTPKHASWLNQIEIWCSILGDTSAHFKCRPCLMHRQTCGEKMDIVRCARPVPGARK